MEEEEGKEKKRKLVEEQQEVVLLISSFDGEDVNKRLKDGLKSSKDLNFGLQELESASEIPSPSSKSLSPSSNKPPKIPTETLTRRPVSLPRSAFSKPKSRFGEPSVVSNVSSDSVELKRSPLRGSNSPSLTSPRNKMSTPTTPKTPLLESHDEEEEDEEIYTSQNVASTMKQKFRKKIRLLVFIEWFTFALLTSLLISSLIVDRLQHFMIWELEIWKWCVLFIVVLCGRLFSEWFINFVTFLITKNFFLKKKLLYFVYGLRKSVQLFIWLGLVLLAWALLFDNDNKRSNRAKKALDYVSKALISSLVGASIWMVKTVLIKILASSFHVSTFFDRIQESIFHQYVLQTLSGPPTMELAENIGTSRSTAQLSFRSVKKKGKGKEEQKIIDVGKLNKLKQGKVSAWTMKGLVNSITNSGLYTFSNTLEEIEEEGEQKEQEITSESEAKVAAYNIFRNVAKPGKKYIDEEDLLRFLSKEEVSNVLPLFEGAAEIRKIKKSTWKIWVVSVYLERKSLAYSLSDTKTAVKQLNKVVSVFTLVVIIIVWLLLMGFATTKVLVFISSQMLLVVFVFGNTAKIVFEAIIFVFVMHPFDVGDRCVIDGVQMIVEEMNILTTVFLRYDNEKIYFPNCILATKSISNFYRSPNMGDGVEFSIDVSTTVEVIGTLKARIKTYIESKPKHWSPNHSVVVKEIVDVDKMRMGLYVTHTMNHQNMGEKNNRRSDLVFELKKIFEELSIQYHLLPQEVHLKTLGQQL